MTLNTQSRFTTAKRDGKFHDQTVTMEELVFLQQYSFTIRLYFRKLQATNNKLSIDNWQ